MFKIDTPKIQQAILMAKAFHFGQKYGSEDYVEYHLFGVAKLAQEFAIAEDIGLENVLIVCILHDITEDTACTYGQISSVFGEAIGRWVNLLDKNTAPSKEEYIADVKSLRLTKLVKTADALFNYTNCIMNGEMNRAKKYSDLLEKLNAN